MRRTIVGSATAVALLTLIGVLGLWWFVLRGDEPPPVSLAGALDAAGVAATDVPAQSSDGGMPGAGQAAGSIDDLEGTWELDPDGSFVGYRVREELAGIGTTTAVGRTSSVTGSLEFDGDAITAVEVIADLRDLRSDDSRRDRQLRRQGLQTSAYPEARFVLSEPLEVRRVPPDRVAIRMTVPGELTLRGVTQEVEVPLEGQLAGDALVVVGSKEIAFADYDIRRPTAPLVLSVEDRAVMELQLIFRIE